MHLPDIDFTVHIDTSEIGCGATNGNNPAGSRWIEEKGNHINYPEFILQFSGTEGIG